MRSSLRTIALSLFCMASGAAAGAQSVAAVSVDCARNQSINRALERHPHAASLVVEIEGLCVENVVVTRDRVTLRGRDPGLDGIQAAVDSEQIDAAVWVRGAHLVSVENLRLTGGFAGLLASEASTPHVRLVNCHLEGNAAYGALLQAALLRAEDTVFDSNGNHNAAAFMGSRLECVRCTLSNPLGTGPLLSQSNVTALTGSRVVLSESTLSEGGISIVASDAFVNDSTIVARPPGPGVPAAIGATHALVNLTRVEVGGALRFNQGTTAQLLGVVQQTRGSGNEVDDDAYVRIGDASPAEGGPPSISSVLLGLVARTFSRATLLQSSQIAGDLHCNLGGDVACTDPSRVSGVSSCGSCQGP